MFVFQCLTVANNVKIKASQYNDKKSHEDNCRENYKIMTFIQICDEMGNV
jgi:hypothetical protein